METINFRVDQEEQGIRIDKYLASGCRTIPAPFCRSWWGKDRCWQKASRLNPTIKSAPGNRSAFPVPDAVEPEIVPEPIPLDISMRCFSACDQ